MRTQNSKCALLLPHSKGTSSPFSLSQRAFKITAASIEGGKSLEEAAKDMERQHKAVAQQLADFDAMKKSLMRDLQDRCEKVHALPFLSPTFKPLHPRSPSPSS